MPAEDGDRAQVNEGPDTGGKVGEGQKQSQDDRAGGGGLGYQQTNCKQEVGSKVDWRE